MRHFFLAECMYHYIQQPPQDINCDPYGTRSTGVSLRCQVLADGPSSAYSVEWFHVPLNSSPANYITFINTVRDNVSSFTTSITSTLTLRPHVDENSAGLYYCQLLLNDQQTVSTVPSDSFRLYAESDNRYETIIQCDSSIPRFKNEVKCAQETLNTTAALSVITSITEAPAVTVLSCGEECVDLIRYMTFAYVLTPLALVIVIILLIICIVYAIRKCKPWRNSKNQTAFFLNTF